MLRLGNDAALGAERETGDCRRRFVTSQPVEEGGEGSQRLRMFVVLPESWKLRSAKLK